MVEQPQERAVLRVLGPVVDEQQRQRLGRVGVGGRPDERRHPEPARQLHLAELSGRRPLVREPLRRRVSGELDDGLRAEGPVRLKRIRGVRPDLRVAVTVFDREQVLEPVDRGPQELELEAAVAALELDVARPHQLVQERHAPERAPRIGQ